MHHSRPIQVIALFGIGALASCSDATAPKPTPVDYLLANVNGSWLHTASSISGSSAPYSYGRPYATTCLYDAATTFFVCPAYDYGSHTFKLSYQLLDAGNVAQSVYDAAVVASVRTVSDVQGTTNYSSTASFGTFVSSSQITSHSDRIMSGLLAGTPTVNGTDSTTSIHTSTITTSTMPATTTTDTIRTVTSIQNFRLPVAGGATKYPIGVVATTMYLRIPTSAASMATTTITATFDGTSKVTYVYVFGTLSSMTCTMDLNGFAAPVCTSPSA